MAAILSGMSQPNPAYGQPQGQSFGPPQNQPQGPAPTGPQGQLVVHMRKPMGWGSAAMISPSIVIDNFPANTQWEVNTFTVPAGTRHLRCETKYMWPYGQAARTVDVTPGQTVEVFYASPMVSFGTGALGFEPQERPGKVAFWLIVGIPLALLLFIVIVSITASLAG